MLKEIKPSATQIDGMTSHPSHGIADGTCAAEGFYHESLRMNTKQRS
jgi:hypothetical protein